MDLLTVTLTVPTFDGPVLAEQPPQNLVKMLETFFHSKGVQHYQVAEVQIVKNADGDEPTRKYLARNFITRRLHEIPLDDSTPLKKHPGNPRVRCRNDKCGWDGLRDEAVKPVDWPTVTTLEVDHGQKPHGTCPQCGQNVYLDVHLRDRRRIIIVVDQYGGSTQTVYSDADDVDIEVITVDSDNDTKTFTDNETPLVVGRVIKGYTETEVFNDSFIVDHQGGCTLMGRDDRLAIMRTAALRVAIEKGLKDRYDVMDADDLNTAIQGRGMKWLDLTGTVRPGPEECEKARAWLREKDIREGTTKGPTPFYAPDCSRFVYAETWEHLDEDNKPYLLRWVFDRKKHDLTDTAELIQDEGVKTQRIQVIEHGGDWWKDVWDHLVNVNPHVLDAHAIEEDPDDYGVKVVDVADLPEWAVEARKATES